MAPWDISDIPLEPIGPSGPPSTPFGHLETWKMMFDLYVQYIVESSLFVWTHRQDQAETKTAENCRNTAF